MTNIEVTPNYKEYLAKVEMPKGAEEGWVKAIVLEVEDGKAIIETAEEEPSKGEIPLSLLSWARKTIKNQDVGGAPTTVKNVLQKGDVIYVEKAEDSVIKAKNLSQNAYQLRQVPNVEGAMVALDPHTGKVLAVVGGYDFGKSQFNRATQAVRQTGSTFKPFVYITALENGYSPTDLILDAPFVLDQGAGLPKWKPVNYSKKFYGPMTLRQGIEKSRNLMTVRLAQDVGMNKVSEMAARLGVNKNLPHLLSMSLGAGDTRLLDMARAYASFVNGGKEVTPYFIERIQNRQGKTILKQDKRECVGCVAEKWEGQDIPQLNDERKQLIDPLSAYQMTSILEGVAVRGTGARLRSLNKHLAGKTGTTNQNKDGWFLGFSPDLVVAVYVGFDEPRTLGRRETGAAVALPIFYGFMKEALANQADIPFRIPTGIKLVRINHDTGKPAVPTDTSVIVEALKPDFDFDKAKQRVIGNDAGTSQDEAGTQSEGDLFESSEDEELTIGGEY